MKPENHLSSTLTLSDLRLWVHLGCTEEEKKHAQCVSLSFTFDFLAPVPAVETDRIEDALCYGTVSDAAKICVQGKRFDTIEYLAGCLFTALEPKVAGKAGAMSVTVHKLTPPVESLHGGAVFTVKGRVA